MAQRTVATYQNIWQSPQLFILMTQMQHLRTVFCALVMGFAQHPLQMETSSICPGLQFWLIKAHSESSFLFVLFQHLISCVNAILTQKKTQILTLALDS